MCYVNLARYLNDTDFGMNRVLAGRLRYTGKPMGRSGGRCDNMTLGAWLRCFDENVEINVTEQGVLIYTGKAADVPYKIGIMEASMGTGAIAYDCIQIEVRRSNS